MLKYPSAGWTIVELRDENGRVWAGPASYLTSVHHDCLDAFIRFYQTGKPQCIHFDAEGWDFMVIIEDFYTYLIISQEKDVLRTFEKRADDLCDELISDIEKNMYAWSRFDFSIENARDRKVEKRRIEQKIARLKRARKLHDRTRYGNRG